MLPSSGQFKDIDCPYYNAICGRPYCHFRHRRKNTDSAEETATEQQTVPTYNPTPKSQLANATGHLPISYVPDLVIRHERRTPLNYEKPTYKPTPKSILSSGVNPESNEYTPTAIITDSDTVDTEVDIGLDVENIDLEDLDTEFGIIDEILSDTSKVEEELLAETSEIATTKDLTKTRKSSKNDSSARKSSKSKSTKNSDSSSKHSNDTNKVSAISEKSKHKDKDSENSNHRNKDSGNSKDKDSTDNGKHRDRDSEKSSHRDKDKSEEKKEKVRSKSRDKATDKEKHKDREKEKEKRKKEKSDCDKKGSSGGSKKEKSSDRTKEKERRKDGDREKDKDRGKRKSDSKSDSKSKSDRNHHSSSKSSKSKDKSDKLDIENVLNSWDDLNDDDNLADLCLDDREDEENDDEATLEEECYKIFSEYKPTPIAELKQRITPNIEDTYIPEDIATLNTGKKRVAYESADRVAASLPSPAPPRYKPLATPAAVMADRLKKARQAASDNEQLRLASEMKRHELNSYNKRIAAGSEEYVPSSKVPRRTSTEDAVSRSKIKVRVARVPQGSVLGPPAAKAKSSSSLVDDIINGRGNSNCGGNNSTSAGSVKNPVKRIAPVMNMGGIQKAKARMDEINRAKAALALKTPAQTLNAGVHRHTQRVAHTPDITSSLSDLPDVVQAAHSKLPVNVRTRYLTLLADETCRLYVGRGAAHARALSEEAKCYERCKVLATYRNSAMLAVNRLRKEVKEREAAGLGPMVDGEEDDKSSTPTDNYHGATFHRLVSKYLLSPAELDLHSFPRPAPHGSSGAVFNTLSAHATAPVSSLASDQRNCARCHRNYLVDEENDGLAVYEQECVYHPLRKRTLRGDSRYLCCKGTDEQGGCVTAPAHVSDGKPAEVGVVQQGYQSTMPSTNTSDLLDPRDLQVYALDCEMCYTTHGLELTRVTIIDSDCRTVYESFVKPLHPIIDYNTRFSGITREQMDRTSTSILQVQANILHLCTDSTILIGHSLESDMKALKIVHGNVVDTSVMFPHKFGLPAKRALRQLASEYLQLIIQNDAEGGHDSAEDARACMELVRWKIREDLKVKGIKQAK